MKRLSVVVIAVSCAVLGSPWAHADESVRRGIVAGLAVGYGRGGGASFAVAADWHIGKMVSPSVAVFLDAGGVMFPSSHAARTGSRTRFDSHMVIGPGAKYWTKSRVWVKGTAGVGQLAGSAPEGRFDDSGFAASASLGFEAFRTSGGSFDLIARASVGVFSRTTFTDYGLLLGFHWH